VGDSGLWTRAFVGLLVAMLVPTLVIVLALLVADGFLSEGDPVLIAVAVVAGMVAWAAIVAVFISRALAEDIQSIRTLAERGELDSAADPGGAYQRLAGALQERNRQVATLASAIADVPIDEEPRRVVTALVDLVRSVVGDPTWTFAILATDDDALLPPAVYPGLTDATAERPIGDLERWASVTLADHAAGAARLDGPWGAFMVVDARVGDRLNGVLLSPWEGRAEPAQAERALLELVGQTVGTALEHSILYARVRAQADQLARLAGVQADFLRGVTHDLQTPLTSIGALATELRAGQGLPDGVKDDLDTIAHQAERLRRMVGQLLVTSRLEAGVLTPQAEVFSVHPLVERTWAALRADRPFHLSIEGEPHLAVADPDRVEQVLWALLDNAVKYSPAASPIRVRIAPTDGTLAIEVSDEGSGMDEETRVRAFDQFYRSEQARRLAPDGSGVGLYAARGLVEAMGGSVSIESRLGRGTTIVIRLPAEPAGAESEGLAAVS
jgi:signal transduction histidine kinase